MKDQYINWVKIISSDSSSIVSIDSSSEVYNQFNTTNAIIFDREAKLLYFIDASANNGYAQKIKAPVEHSLYIKSGNDNIIEYNGTVDVSIDSSLLHKKYNIDASDLITEYDASNGILKSPILVLDSDGHISNVNHGTIYLTGDNDSSLVTIEKTRILFAEYAAKFQIEPCGKGTNVEYVLPDPSYMGKSYKCVDSSIYYYSDGSTKITRIDKYGREVNPNAGDVIMCSATNPVKWTIIANDYEQYTDKLSGVVPAYNDSSNAILFAEEKWGYLDGSKGIKIVNNKIIEHINDISAGTIGQQYDQEGEKTDDLYIPHAISVEEQSPEFVIHVPKITYDEEGHIASVIDSSVTIEVSKIKGGDYPSLTTKFIDASYDASTVVYDPNNSDVELDLTYIHATNAEDASKLAGRNVTSDALNIDNPEVADTFIPTGKAVNEYVNAVIPNYIDDSSSLTSENAIRNSIFTSEIDRIHDKFTEDREYVDGSLDLKADKINVLALDNEEEYIPDTSYNPATKLYVDNGDASLWEIKQNKLSPGPGVVISQESEISPATISFSADTFIIVDGSVAKKPSDDYIEDISAKITDPIDNKIYLWRLYDPSEGEVTKPIYIEFTCVFVAGIFVKWIEIGRFRLDFLIENRLKTIDSSVKKLEEEHVFLTEEEYEELSYKDPNKIYFTYESDEPGGIDVSVMGETLVLLGDSATVEDGVLYIVGDASVINGTLILNGKTPTGTIDASISGDTLKLSGAGANVNEDVLYLSGNASVENEILTIQ